MPGKVKVRVVAGRNLPVMDRSSDTTDAFAEVKLGDTTFKTDVYRKSLNPAWNSDWFKFEVDDLELQDEPLQIRIMDYDTYSANDAIGKVYIDLNPLLLPQPGQRPVSLTESSGVSLPVTGGGCVMSGWLPVYDTMHGIRGEVQIIVKVELFSDLNKFRQSSCGVQFFCSPEVPEGFKAQFLPGFVEELVVNDDPEYKWIDKIRTPRASNEARQLLFSKLSGEVRRKIGLKALELGGNAVIGYRQNFDLEGESGIVVRGIGTAVTLSRLQHGETVQSAQLSPGISTSAQASSSPPRASRENSAGLELAASPEATGDVWPESPATPGVSCGPQTFHSTPSAATPLTNGNNQQCLKSATSKEIGLNVSNLKCESEHGTPPRGASAGSSSSEKHAGRHIRALDKEMPEFPFLTITKLPPGFLLHLGGMVSSKSVKLLEELDDREDSDAREAWWVEIRQEVRSHAKALGCNMIVGYQEKTVIWDDVLILTSSGTAAVCNLGFMAELDTSGPVSGIMPGRMPGSEAKILQSECSVCHIPYLESSVPFPIKLVKCGQCGRGKVPDILLTTVEPPPMVEILGQGGLIQARVLRLKKDLKGENNAREVSDALPFMEYEIHRQLVNKLKVKGMNAIFGLTVDLSMSDRMLVALVTGTAVYLSALPSPDVPKVLDTTCQVQDPTHLARLQAKLREKVEANKEYFGLAGVNPKDASEAEVEEKGSELELSAGNKDTCVLEVDDIDDADIVDSLLDAHPPPGFQVISVHTPVGEDQTQAISLCQTFSQVWRGKLPCTSRDFSSASQHLVAAVCFKLRRMQPCLISSLEWSVDLDDENEVQISVSGVAVAFVDKKEKDDDSKKKDSSQEERELMFRLDEVQPFQPPPSEGGSDRLSLAKLRQARPPPYFFSSLSNPKFGINMTPAPFIPGARIDHHLGSLNFFFIRESTNIRETGGLSTFVQRFLSEVLGILRAHVSSLGGNAVTSYFMSSCILSHVPHKNQAQCLINVGGDIVSVSYVCK
eukprot:TRINITY_DN12088_c0_g1_i1.p1 TRINITY_DN12088_c0_g1~~TRINITY_DN12088_c0_g1_i1.p1  ORF type:complete len:1008 (-),score=354.04 TRINITY_DN12088_c0_g1_i1:52-3075(-)